jgi:signal peptidase II
VTASPYRPRSRLRAVILTAALALTADIVSKVLIVANIGPYHRPVRIFGGAISLIQTRNSGAAFSVGTGATVVLTLVSVVVVIIIARSARQLTSSWWAGSLGLVLGGALGNLTDRLFRAPSPGRGHVVDWIALHTIDGYQYPIFNLADSSIVVGAVIAVILSVLGVEFRGHSGADSGPRG